MDSGARTALYEALIGRTQQVGMRIGMMVGVGAASIPDWLARRPVARVHDHSAAGRARMDSAMRPLPRAQAARRLAVCP